MIKTVYTALMSVALLIPLSPDAIAETNGPTIEFHCGRNGEIS